MDKNIQNVMGNKYLFSLGHDYNVNPATGEVDENSEYALVFKIWDFISLDSK